MKEMRREAIPQTNSFNVSTWCSLKYQVRCQYNTAQKLVEEVSILECTLRIFTGKLVIILAIGRSNSVVDLMACPRRNTVGKPSLFLYQPDDRVAK